MTTGMTIGGVEMTRRAARTVGTLRAVSRLEREFGVSIIQGLDGEQLMDLLVRPGGVRALLHVLAEGPVDEIDEDALEIDQLLEAVSFFYKAYGTPSAEHPDGSQPNLSGEGTPGS
jgi:hypothetical protein